MKLKPSKKIADKCNIVKVQRSVDYLLSKRDQLKKYEDIEDFFFHEPEDSKFAKSIEVNLIEIRSRVARELWGHGFYISHNVLDSLLFSIAAHTDDDNLLLSLLETIRNSGIHKPGFIIYPLHSLGILGYGLFHHQTGSKVYFTNKAFGYTVSGQSNSFDQTIDFIKYSKEQFGVKHDIPFDLIEHWRKSRPTAWLEKNPLVAQKIHSFPGTYYDTQFFLLTKLQIATSILLALSAIQNESQLINKDAFLTSSSRVNRFHTLDIKHYIYMYPKPHSKMLDGSCVPMNKRTATLAELSDVPIEIHPKFWRARYKTIEAISNRFTKVESLYVAYMFKAGRKSVEARVAMKLFDSLKFFRRSFKRTDDGIDSIVNIAIAFEVLLTDSYAPGISDRLEKRLCLAISNPKIKEAMLKAVNNLYYARSEIVHTGTTGLSVDISKAQLAFTHAFIGVVDKLHKLPRSSDKPIGDILGD